MDAVGLIGLFLLLFGGKGDSGSPAPAPRALPPGGTPPWPNVIPPDLPAFPGPGWEYDEPPPQSVQRRAGELVNVLWGQGKGAHKTEQTDGRWITYRAEIVRSGKKGVTAWRLKSGGGGAPAAPESRAPAPRAAPQFPAILTSTSPGWPQPQAGERVIETVAGRWYQWSLKVEAPPGMAEGIARGIAAGGGVDVVVSNTPPYAVGYRQKAVASMRIPLGKRMRLQFGSVEVWVTFLQGREVPAPDKAPNAPGVVMTSSTPAPGHVPIAVPGGTIFTEPPRTSSAPPGLPTLRQGRGMKPQAPDRHVKLAQQKMGMSAADADGRFGPATKERVIAFQRTQVINKLGWTYADVDGVIGPKTWEALYESPWVQL